jgi:hypothetical protein
MGRGGIQGCSTDPGPLSPVCRLAGAGAFRKLQATLPRRPRERGDPYVHRKLQAVFQGPDRDTFIIPPVDMLQRYATGLWVPAFAGTTGKVYS